MAEFNEILTDLGLAGPVEEQVPVETVVAWLVERIGALEAEVSSLRPKKPEAKAKPKKFVAGYGHVDHVVEKVKSKECG